MAENRTTQELRSAAPDSDFVKTINRKAGANVFLCYQCHKCTAGCPLAFAMEEGPSSIMQAIKLGLKERVLYSNTIWVCTSCKACAARCPQGIDVAAVMEEARHLAEREGIRPREKEIEEFYSLLYWNIGLFGRMYEPGLIALLKIKTGNYLDDLPLGIRMFLQGKLRPLPSIAGNLAELRKILHRAEELEKKRDET